MTYFNIENLSFNQNNPLRSNKTISALHLKYMQLIFRTSKYILGNSKIYEINWDFFGYQYSTISQNLLWSDSKQIIRHGGKNSQRSNLKPSFRQFWKSLCKLSLFRTPETILNGRSRFSDINQLNRIFIYIDCCEDPKS